MPEETSSTQPIPEPTPKPAPKERKPEKTPTPKKKGGWFQKIPKDILFSPAGVVLILFAIFMEIFDWIPIPFFDQIWELPLEIVFIILLALLAKVPLKASITPFIIERIPLISDLLPTWVIRMFV
jgi:hypothetical protein